MRSFQSISATGAPSIFPELQQAARISARVRVSSATADVLADLAFGSDRRDQTSMLASVVANRIGASCNAGVM